MVSLWQSFGKFLENFWGGFGGATVGSLLCYLFRDVTKKMYYENMLKCCRILVYYKNSYYLCNVVG